jgi:predicted nucleic acid-binding protein
LNLFVDTSVWSLALRRDRPGGEKAGGPAVPFLEDALRRSATVYTTGLVLQELLQGFSGPKARAAILASFAALALLVPDREDHVAAAELRNGCRRRGLQIGTIDALLAQVCLRHDLLMLTTDADFMHVARFFPLRVWKP